MRANASLDTGTNISEPDTKPNKIGTTPGYAGPSGLHPAQPAEDPTLSDSDLTPLSLRNVATKTLGGLLSLALLVAVWWAIVLVAGYPAFILPSPPAVASRMWSMLLDGSLLGHAWTTIIEASLGFLLAFTIGVGLGYPIARSRKLERLLNPYIAVSQALPVVALAPLLVIWFRDNDLLRNIVIVALICFFPILVNTIVGIRGLDRSLLEVARISGANFWQTVYYVELPLGMRSLLGGVKLGITLSITGAVIGELVSATSGLGFLLVLGKGLFDTTLIFVGLASLALLALAAYALVTLLERVIITWE